VARRPVAGDGGDARDLQNQFIEQIESFERVLEEVRRTHATHAAFFFFTKEKERKKKLIGSAAQVREAERETAKLVQRVQTGPTAPNGTLSAFA
jgi:hypothetical protein